MLQREKRFVKNLQRLKKTDIAKFNKVLTTTSLPEQLQSIVSTVHKLSSETNDKINYIEIGMKYGGSFRYVLDNTKNLVIEKYYGFDLFEDFVVNQDNTHKGDVANMNDIKNKLESIGHSNFTLIKGDSLLTINEYLPKLDKIVAFIDGNHTYNAVKSDFNNIAKKSSSGSYFILDDTNWPGVRIFLNELLKSKRVKHIKTGQCKTYDIVQLL